VARLAEMGEMPAQYGADEERAGPARSVPISSAA
jgi:hypothetical protein